MYSKSKLNCQGPYICLPWQCLSIVKPICTHIDPQDVVRTLLPFYCKVPRIQLSRVPLRRRPAITQGPNPSAGVWHFSGPQNGYLEGGGGLALPGIITAGGFLRTSGFVELCDTCKEGRLTRNTPPPTNPGVRWSHPSMDYQPLRKKTP